MPKHLRNVLSILKPQSATGTSITSPQLQSVTPGEREPRDSKAPSRITCVTKTPGSPVRSRYQPARNHRVYSQNRKRWYIWRYTRLAVKNHWPRATRLVLDGTIRLVGVATYASVVHGPYSDERSARCDSTRVKILRHAHKALFGSYEPERMGAGTRK